MIDRRSDFPILGREIGGRPLIYLDSAATALKPRSVIDAVTRFYLETTANVHRAAHRLSEDATEAYEAARARIAHFVHADPREVAFVRNTTEAINVVAATLREIGPIAVPVSEHHSNLLPWLPHRVLIDSAADGCIDLASARRVLAESRPALLTFSTVGGAFGTRQPTAELMTIAREHGVPVLLDVSQSVGHEPVDLRGLGCDYACFSGHKMLGPSGVGVLFQREGAARTVRPLLLGGSMVKEVHLEEFVAQPFPWALEAGTPNIEGALGLAAACEYLFSCGLREIAQHCDGLAAEARRRLAAINGVRVHGPSGSAAAGIVAFTAASVESPALARVLSDRFGIMVRAGYHCTQPLHEATGISETVRASFHLYNTATEVDSLASAVSTIIRMF